MNKLNKTGQVKASYQLLCDKLKKLRNAVKTVKKAIDETNKHLSILGLAYDSGFNSKSVFNDYFKKAVGQTPKGWLKNQ